MINLIASSSQMKSIEKRAADHFKISFVTMMENAGECVFKEIEKHFGDSYGKRFLVLCGGGNNGGDGLVAAGFLVCRHAVVKVLLVNGMESLNENCKTMLTRLPNDILINSVTNEELESFDFIIDAVYGTGFHGVLDKKTASLFKVINNTKAKKIAVDLPSSTVCDSGYAEGNLLNCDLTVTFALPKPCHFLFPAAEYTGRLSVCDIGIPLEAILEEDIKTEYITKEQIDKIIPIRKRNTHKGDYGKLLSICGSRYMTGAAALSALGALKSGVGLLTLLLPDEILDILQTKLLEPVFSSYNRKNIYKKLDALIKKNNTVLFGCGCGEGITTLNILKFLLKTSLPLVLDADALNTAARYNISLNRNYPTVITPHPLEFSRLTGKPLKEIEEDRIRIAREYSKKENVITVLKGAYTIIAEPFGKVYINTGGNAGMAKGGSGDILAGIIASLIAQGINPCYAALSGVYFHSAAGDAASNKLSQYGMTPEDLTKELPLLFKKYNGA